MIIVGTIFTIVLILAVIILVATLNVYGFGRKTVTRKRGNAISIDKSFVQNKWAEIETSFSVGGASNIKSAVMEADKLVDYVLKARGMRGETMGERLKSAKSKFTNYADYDNLWKAHKLRNNIAHEAGHDLVVTEAKKAMEYFKKALAILGGL